MPAEHSVQLTQLTIPVPVWKLPVPHSTQLDPFTAPDPTGGRLHNRLTDSYPVVLHSPGLTTYQQVFDDLARQVQYGLPPMCLVSRSRTEVRPSCSSGGRVGDLNPGRKDHVPWILPLILPYGLKLGVDPNSTSPTGLGACFSTFLVPAG